MAIDSAVTFQIGSRPARARMRRKFMATGLLLSTDRRVVTYTAFTAVPPRAGTAPGANVRVANSQVPKVMS